MYRILICTLLLFLLFSCAKEKSVERPAVSRGFLRKNSNGDCEGVLVSGTYIARQTLADSNFLEVRLTVTKPGFYQISTDSINGYSFQASGNFADTGVVKLRLHSTGSPLVAGTDHFNVSYDSSHCTAAITVSRNLEDPARLGLFGVPGTCMEYRVLGPYVSGHTLDSSNFISVKVQVDEPGSFTIKSDTVNGYSYSVAGKFTTPGVKTISVNATGSPLAIGTNHFILKAGTSTCSFDVNVLMPIPVVNTDHFPLTQNSFWTYDHTLYKDDSLTRKVNGNATKDGVIYATVDEHFATRNDGQLLFLKTTNLYLEYADAGKYTNSFSYADPVEGDLLFLKEGLAKGETWQSEEFKGKASFGQVIYVQYQYVCLDNDALAIVNGNVFENVYKIRLLPTIKSEFAGWGRTNETYELWYAKGVGLIYEAAYSQAYLAYSVSLRRWKVF